MARLTAGFVEATVVIAALAAGAGVASPAPTRIVWWDAILRIAFVLAFAGLGRRIAPRWWFVLGPPAIVFCGLTWWSLAVLVATGFAALVHFGHLSAPRSGLLGGGLLGLALMHLPDLGFFGASALMAATLFVVAAVGAELLKALPRPVVRVVAGSTLLLAGLTAAVGVVSAQGLASGVETAERALIAQRSGRVEEAERFWNESKVSFAEADRAAGGWLSQPLRLVPVVGPHVELGGVLASAGVELSAIGTEIATDVDFASWVDEAGTIDAAQMSTAQQAVTRLNQKLFAVETDLQLARNPWILRHVDDRIADGIDLLRSSRADGEVVAEALRLLPDAVGASEPKTYLIVFANPAETRELGGLLSAYAIARFDNGALSIVETAVNDRLVREIPKDALTPTLDYPRSYLAYDLVQYPLNLTGTPSMQHMFTAVRDLFPSYLGRVDGLVYLDPFVIEALVGLGPPLRLPDSSIVLTGDNTAEFLLRSQYVEIPEAHEREQALLSVVEGSVRGLVSRLFQDPARLERVLSPLIATHRVQMISVDNGATNALLERAGLLTPFGPTPGHDFLAVMQANQGENKLDAFSSKDVSYNVRVNPATSSVVASLRIQVQSTASASLPESVRGVGPLNDPVPGTNHMVLSVYSPHLADVAQVDGQVVETRSIREFGLWRHSVTLVIPPESTVVLDLTLIGTLESAASGGYQLDVWQQPLVEIDTTTVSVATTGGWQIGGAKPFEAATQQIMPGAQVVDVPIVSSNELS